MTVKTYGSVNGQSKELKTIYGSVNGQSKKLMKLYGSVNGVSKLIYEEASDETQYGKVYYYSTFTGPSWSDAGSTNMVIQSIDTAGLANFVSQRNVMVDNGKIDMWYWADGNNVSYQQEGGGWSQIDVNTLYTQYNIQAWRGPDYNNQGELLINYSAGSVDKTSTIVSADLLSSTEYTGLGNNTSANPFNTCTVGGNTIPFAAIQKFVFGTDNTTTPACLLRSSGVEELSFRYAESITSIGGEFLEQCSEIENIPALPSTITSIGNLFMYGCTSFNSALDLSNVTSIGSNFLSGCTSFNGALTFNENATLNTMYFLSSCSSFNQPLSIPSGVTSIGTSFMSGCQAFNQPLSIPSGVTSIGNYFMSGCSSFNQDITFPASLSSIGTTNLLRNCNAMVSTVTWESPMFAASGDANAFSTTDSSSPCYTTGITFAGTYGAEWAQRFPNKASSPYRKILCADTTEDYGVVYHYGYTEGWVSAGWTQNVTWEITNQTTWNNWVSLHGGASNAQFNFWYENNIWKVYIQTTGAQTSIADMLEETGITVTSTVGGFQQGDGWSMKYGMSVDTSTGILKTTLASTADFNKLVSSSDAYVSWALSQRTVYSEAVLNVVVGAAITSLPNSFLRYCRNLRGIYISSSVTNIGDYCMRYTGLEKQANIDLASVTSIGGYFMYYCSSFNGTLTLTSLQSVGTQFLNGCSSYNKSFYAPALTTIGSYFMQSCTAYNSSLSTPVATSVGNYFLAGCTSFNQWINAEVSSFVTIGNYFMYNCTSFNQPFTLQATVTSIGTYFMYNCKAMTSAITVACAATVAATSNYTLATNDSSAFCYTTGITLKGTYRSAWHSRFPDRTSSPYRKTIAS